MKNIILVTRLYPIPGSDNKATSAIHYFTREWVKMGYNVIVIHIAGVHVFFYYWITKLFAEKMRNITGAIIYTKKDKKILNYEMDSVPIYKIPAYRMIPHGRYPKKTIDYLISSIKDIVEKRAIKLDLIIGHFMEPLELVPELKKVFNVPSCMVTHGEGQKIKKRYDNYAELLASLDVWGFRSLSIKKNFEEMFGVQKKTFMCYSGIPEKYISPSNNFFEHSLYKFCCVGDLIKQKRIDTIIYALAKAYPSKNFELNIIGSGAEMEFLRSLSDKLGIKSQVRFWGKISRDEVQHFIKESDCFILVSHPEAFGLVYLEAMGKGCITIGSKNEGIDGVIVDGVNGFLCAAGNRDELADKITYINNLSPKQRLTISQNAIETARNFTDFKAADKYINDVINLLS